MVTNSKMGCELAQLAFAARYFSVQGLQQFEWQYRRHGCCSSTCCKSAEWPRFVWRIEVSKAEQLGLGAANCNEHFKSMRSLIHNLAKLLLQSLACYGLLALGQCYKL